MVCPLKPSGNLHGRERCQTAYSSPNLARDVSGRLLMGPPQSLCQSLCFGLIIEPTSIFLSSLLLVCQGTWSRKGRAEREGRVGRAAQDTKGLSPSPVTKVPSHTTALQRGMAGSFPLASARHLLQPPPPQKDQVQFGLTQSPFEPCLSD